MSQTCPDCNESIESHIGFIKWCPACNWNLTPNIPEPSNILESTYAKLGTHQSKQLFEEMLNAETLAPRMTGSKIAAYLLATVIHLICIAMVAFSLWLIINFWPNLFAICTGIILLLVSIFARPRMGTWPNEVKTRNDLPETFALVDKISDALGIPPIDGMLIDWNFNASYDRPGIRSKQLLTIGLPLFYHLDEQERIALIGHELAHAMNGDSLRSRYIGMALSTLLHWHWVTYPTVFVSSENAWQGLVMIPVNLLRYGFAYLILLLGSALSHLLWRDSQRAEYLADVTAAEVSGTDAVCALLEKLHMGKSYYVAAGRYTLNHTLQKEMTAFEYVAECLKAVPESENERIRRAQEIENSRLNVTHPPSAFRREAMLKRPIAEPKVKASKIDFEPIMKEFAGLEKSVQSELMARRGLL